MLPLPLYILREVLWHLASIPSRIINTLHRKGRFANSMNQTFSARCHMEASHGDQRWLARESFVNFVVFWEADHCKRASDAAVERAEKTLRYNDKAISG